MKSQAQIEQRISHLKEREKEVDVSLEIEALTYLTGYTPESVWTCIERIARENSDKADNKTQAEDIKGIRILLWVLED